MYQARYTDESTLLIQVTSVKIPVVPLKEKKGFIVKRRTWIEEGTSWISSLRLSLHIFFQVFLQGNNPLEKYWSVLYYIKSALSHGSIIRLVTD